VKLLAVLLRRAKKRCRPLWRTIVARTFQTVGVLILCFIIYVAWFFSGKPVITTDYVAEINNIFRPAADESMNATPYYQKAAKMLGKLPDDTLVLLRKEYDEVTPGQKKRIERCLTDNEEILELVTAGARKQYYWQRYKTGEGIEGVLSVLSPSLYEFRNLARALVLRAQLRAEQGRHKDAFDDIKSCYRLGQHLKTGAFLIGQLMGFSIEHIAIKTLLQVLDEHEINLIMLTELQQDFRQMVADEAFRIHLEGEKLLGFDEIQRSFTGGPGRDHIIPKRIAQLYPEVQIMSSSSSAGGTSSRTKQEQSHLSKFKSTVWHEFRELGGFVSEAGRFVKKNGYVLFLHPNKQQTSQATQDLYDYFENLTDKTPGQIRAEAIDVKKDTMGITEGNMLLEMLEPAVVRIIELSHQNKTNVQSLVTILALLRHKGDKGFCPENLQELITTGYLKKLPADPYSDKPLVYKKTDDNFILYSVGPNFTDDGGEPGKDSDGRVRKWRKNGDTVFWPLPEPQTNQ